VVHRVRGLVKKGESDPQTLSINEVVGEVLELARADLQHRGIIAGTRLVFPASTSPPFSSRCATR
jgi:hypothetical protein